MSGRCRTRTALLALAAVLALACAAGLAVSLCTPPPAFADAKPQPAASEVVRVACYEDGDYMSVDEKGMRRGYNIEYLEEVARYGGWTYEYVDYPSWKSAYAAILAGEADMIPAVYRTDERSSALLFSQLPSCETFVTLNVREDDTRHVFEGFASLNGLRAGVIAESRDAEKFAAFCKENNFSMDIVPYEKTADLLAALDNGDVDAVAITYLGKNSRFRTVCRFGAESIYTAFPNDRETLARDFNLALTTMKLRDPGFEAQLHSRYFSLNEQQDPVFTQEEYDYLASAPTLKVAYDPAGAPLSYTDPKTGEYAGVTAKLFRNIADKTGLQFEFVPVDRHDNAIDLLMQGKADLMYGTNPNIGKRTEGGVQATGKYLSNHMVLVMGTNPEGNRVALQRGRTLSAEIAESMAHDSVTVDCDTAKACLDAVLADKADRACIDGYVASYLVSESQYRSLAVATIGEFTNDLSIGVRGDLDPRLISILNRCIYHLPKSTMTTWLTESSLAEHSVTPLDVLRQYPLQTIGAIATLFALLLAGALYAGRSKITAARRIEDALFMDPLTGGWTVARFRAEVSQRLDGMENNRFALAYLDIKRFKSFNAACGYETGDQLIKGLASLIDEIAEPDEAQAHVIADEFVALFHWRGWENAKIRFENLDSRLNELPVLQPLSYRPLLYAGVCLIDQTGKEDLPADARLATFMDCARYARDSIGEISRSTVAFYSSSMKEREVRERKLASLARNALEQGEFTAYYQPKVDIATGRIVGFEALARWNSPEFGLMSPAEFIPLLERNGMVVELDLHLFDLACKRIRDCLDKTGQAPFIACNFSRRHLSTNDFPRTLKRIAQRHETPISHLELELTESIVIDNPQHARSVCRQLKQMGFRISIDDFGSGYSSLGTLHDIPFDVLKLDRSLLLSAQDSISGWAILESTVKIATRLNARVVVEGVETPEQADMLLKLDCNVVAQGYLYSRPVAREESDTQFDAGRLEPCAQPAPDTGR